MELLHSQLTIRPTPQHTSSGNMLHPELLLRHLLLFLHQKNFQKAKENEKNHKLSQLNIKIPFVLNRQMFGKNYV